MSLVKLETLASLEKGAPRDPKGKEERRASQALLVLLGRLDPKGLLEMTGRRAARAPWVFLVILVPPESLGLRVRMARLVTKETTGNQGKRVPLDPLENQVPLDLQERGVLLAQQGPKADRGRKEPREKLAWKVLLGRLAPSAPRVLLGNQAPMVCGGSLALWVNKASQDLLALMGPLAPWVPQDFLASKETLAPKGKRGTQA